MGIGNLNNNFGKLTTSSLNKANNAETTGKAENTENIVNTKVKLSSLSSATLGDEEGKLFDSNNMKDNSEISNAPKGKGKKEDFWSRFGRLFAAMMNRTGGAHFWSSRFDPMGDTLSCAFLAKFADDKTIDDCEAAWGGKGKNK